MGRERGITGVKSAFLSPVFLTFDLSECLAVADIRSLLPTGPEGHVCTFTAPRLHIVLHRPRPSRSPLLPLLDFTGETIMLIANVIQLQ